MSKASSVSANRLPGVVAALLPLGGPEGGSDLAQFRLVVIHPGGQASVARIRSGKRGEDRLDAGLVRRPAAEARPRGGGETQVYSVRRQIARHAGWFGRRRRRHKHGKPYEKNANSSSVHLDIVYSVPRAPCFVADRFLRRRQPPQAAAAAPASTSTSVPGSGTAASTRCGYRATAGMARLALRCWDDCPAPPRGQTARRRRQSSSKPSASASGSRTSKVPCDTIVAAVEFDVLCNNTSSPGPSKESVPPLPVSVLIVAPRRPVESRSRSLAGSWPPPWDSAPANWRSSACCWSPAPWPCRCRCPGSACRH